MRRFLAVLGFTALLGGAAFALVVPNGASVAAVGKGESTFLIPASDGYGVADCLSNGSDCGTVVANAWCEAQGYARAASFGLAAPEDATGSIEKVAAVTGSDRPIAITCTDE